MTDLRAAVFAYSEVGFVCLRELVERGVTVQALFTYEDDPKEEIWFPSAAGLARSAGIPVYTPPLPGDEEYRLLADLKPDVIFSFYYRSMIAERFLDIPPKGAFNIHGSLLPRYRGRACINWAVLNGETETGATLHHMVGRADAGDIVDREKVPILFEDTSFDVGKKVAEAARILVARNIERIAEGTAPRIPQREEDATIFGRRTPADGIIPWNKSAVEIYNLVRAVTHPFPGAFTFLAGRKLYVWKALPEKDERRETEPGTILSMVPPVVQAGDGAVRILRAQWEGEEERDCTAPGFFPENGVRLG
ncbi:MAG: formyltransferase [Synergistaceae bacterium]|nr:formyltransferase [Synergistaceae bacterium]